MVQNLEFIIINCIFVYKYKIMKIKNIVNKQKIDTSKYVNIDTGQTLQDENPHISSLNTYNKDLVLLDSKEYVVIDSKALAYITNHFSSTEIGRITRMADMVKGCYNILHTKEDVPHTDETLMEAIEYTRNKFSDFMKKLCEKSIIYYVIGFDRGKKVKYILLNPRLARKTKTVHKECLAYFSDITTIE